MNTEIMMKRADSLMTVKDQKETFRFYFHEFMDSAVIASLVLALVLKATVKALIWSGVRQ